MCRNSLLPTERTDFFVGGCLDPHGIRFNLEQGRKIAADVITRGVLDWWCTEGNLKYGEGATFGSLNDSFGYGFRPHAVDKDTKRKAVEDCRKHVKKVYSQYGSLLASFIMSIIINLIVRAVTELIIDWLFSYAGDKQ